MINLRRLDRHRQAAREIEFYGQMGNEGNGMFAFKSPVDQKTLHVVASNGFDWEHVSVSKTNKMPSWREMEWIKNMFFKPDEVAMQLHVARSDHISFHAFCLHLWRPLKAEIPLPPAIMVGPKEN